MEYVGGGLGAAAGAALGFIAADVPGAYVGGQVGWKAGKNFAKNKTKEMPPRRRYNSGGMVTPPRTPANIRRTSPKQKSSKKIIALRKAKLAGKKKFTVAKHPYKFTSVATGAYGGRFKQPAPNMKSFILKCQKSGYTCQVEKYGTVADANVIYVYHSTFDVNNIARSIIGAILRRTFNTSGIEILNENTELPLRDGVDSYDYMIRYADQNPVDGLTRVWQYEIPNNATFKSLLDAICIYAGGTPFQQIIDYMFNGANAWYIPLNFTLLIKDKYTVGGFDAFQWRTKTQINLSDEVIVMQCRSALTLQNRTKGSGAAAGDFEIERVDNQPLKGKLYEFGNGDPRVRAAQVLGTGVTNHHDDYYNTGAPQACRAFGGTAIADGYMREPPQGKFWKNCTATSTVSLEPGVMKKGEITVNYKAKLPELLKKFRVDVAGSLLGVSSYHNLRSHKAQILGLEEVLRTPSDNLITAQYEVENTCAAYCYPKKTKGVFRVQQFEESVAQTVPS
jgi:hypothetical protein